MLILLWLFIAGASVGSFLNVCIWRLPRGESVVAPPSHCPKCDRQLQTLDLVPLLSQLFLRSRCRYCGTRISWRYFGIELLTGILWVLVGAWAGPFGIHEVTGAWTGDWLRLAQGLIFVSCLVVIFWVDYDTRLIQLEAVFLMALAGVALDVWRTMHNPQLLSSGGFWPGHSLLPSPLPGSLWAMVVISTLLWAVREGFSWFYGKEALGFGDVILAGAIAANLGWNATLWTFSFCSVVVGALVGVGLQIPRAVRAYRWAKRRSVKYLERASSAGASGTSIAISTAASDAGLQTNEAPDRATLETELGANQQQSDEEVLTAQPVLATSDATQTNSTVTEEAGSSSRPPFEAVAYSAGDDKTEDASALAMPDVREAEREAVTDERREELSGQAAQNESEAAPAQPLSDRERGEHWQSLASSLARHAFRKAIPFGPMLAIGATLALLYGEPLNRAYLSWLGNPTADVTSVPRDFQENVPPLPP
ncbi:MAG: leader peptidase (prepilin peptidase) / N-methyltransferase [Abditibacteriota bacterium]|nr:leader peptidase (prepilin peptidase) / N-methyltransferase [Abditibacteriota bacterium]